jgi:hypothetical protein
VGPKIKNRVVENQLARIAAKRNRRPLAGRASGIIPADKKRPRRKAGRRNRLIADESLTQAAIEDHEPASRRRRRQCADTLPASRSGASGLVAARIDPRNALAACWCDGAMAGLVVVEARKLGGDIVGAAHRVADRARS